MSGRIRTMLLCGILLMSSVVSLAQEEEQTIEDHLVALAHQLRMCLTLATVAAHSPTIIDLRLHAQQLINLLEGNGGVHFIRSAVAAEIPLGLIRGMTLVRTRLEQSNLEDEALARVKASIKNVSTYLGFSLSAALSGLDQRRMDLASSDMLRAYAFLLAAYENPCDVAYVPALWTILRAYDLTGRVRPDEEG